RLLRLSHSLRSGSRGTVYHFHNDRAAEGSGCNQKCNMQWFHCRSLTPSLTNSCRNAFPANDKIMTAPRMQVFPTQFSIGPVTIAPATVLAPMAGVTDTVFRRFIRNLGGCGLIMTEFTSSHGVRASMGARKPTKTLKRYLAFEPEEHPISAQLFGADPEVMADAARVCQDLGFDILDINFGCPVNKVVKCNGGSGL